jgi:DNA (cytosine-5)-methyltransferase 1
LLARKIDIALINIHATIGIMANNKKIIDFKLGELFCGPGGIAVGAKNATVISDNVEYRISHAWSTDYDKDTCDTFSKNICGNKTNSVICKDIRKLDLQRLKDISPIDALAFGFPCNDFSIVGEQKGINGVYGPLYSYGVEVLNTFKPKWFLAENVGGLKNANEGKTFQLIMSDLFNSGYSVYPHLYSFDKYGVPQSRQRIIIVGIRKDLDLSFIIPSPAPYEELNISCRNALENPPIPEDAINNELTKQSKQVVERLKWIRPGENAFTAELPDHLKLNIKGAKISQIYKRLDPNKPAYTVTGSGGGGTHMYHWKEPRALTNRERARLQTFPDDFVFCGSKESVRKQIGMAVPCKGVQVVFEAILKSFAGISYPSIEPSYPPMIHPCHLPFYNQDKSTGQLLLLENKVKYG